MNDTTGELTGERPLGRIAPVMAKGEPAPAGARLRLHTMVLIRWIALAGQASAVAVVHVSLGFGLPLLPVLLVIALSAAVNIHAGLNRAGRTWLRDHEAAAYLAFDLTQLSVLLGLTGGLANPFSFLLLAPLTVSASFLSRTATLVLSLCAVIAATVLAFVHLPLPWSEPGLTLPTVYIAGIWAALVLAIAFIPGSVASVAAEGRRLSDALSATQMALAREQRLSALGGLAAAAAHELGSPLGTITVVAKELTRELPEDSAEREDAALILSESARCREILARLAASPDVAEATPFDRLPVSALIETAAQPYRGEAVDFTIQRAAPREAASNEPTLWRSPELLHGLGTLIQNAMQFARARVEIEIAWDDEALHVVIRDDGPGFDSEVLPHLGEPYVSARAKSDREAGDGDHMGLGIFIARTLLSHTGARLAFGNRDRRDGVAAGAEVAITWPRAIFDKDGAEARRAGASGTARRDPTEVQVT